MQTRTSIVTIAPPVGVPVYPAEAKAWLRIGDDDHTDDAVIGALSLSAWQKVERDTGLRLLTQTVAVSVDQLPSHGEPLQLYTGPAQSIASVTWYDTAGHPTELDPATYRLDRSRSAGRVVLVDGARWPSSTRRYTALTVEAIVGYGNSSAVPETLKLAIKLLVSEWLTCGEGAESAAALRSYEALIAPYRLQWIL